MRKRYILPVILLVFFIVSGCGNRREEIELIRQTTPSYGETEAQTVQKSPETGADTGGSTEEGERYPVGRKGDEYILPAAETHVYSAAELSGLSREELRLARNELYARHGRIFQADDLNRYFMEKEWYEPSKAADVFDVSVLSRTESDNLKAVLEAEELLVSEAISCPKSGREQYPVVDGSTATLPLSQAIYRLATGSSGEEAEAFVAHSKTTQAYLNLIQGQGVDLVIAYEPGESVKESLEENGNNIIIKPIGRDALVFMANGKNPVKSLTQRQVLDIYTGKITNWKELGGKDLTIKAFQRPRSSGSQNLMDKLVLKGRDMIEAPQEFIFSEMDGVIAGLASYDNTGEALGYSVYYYAKNMYEKPELKFMGIDGVVPSSDSIRSGSYPYANDFYAAIRKDEPEDSQAYQLFEWLTSDDGQALINALGYVGVRDVQKPLPEGFEDGTADFSGEIPLEEGEVILGDGKYLYGESGIAVFDGKMRLTRFMEHVRILEGSIFVICPGDSVVPALDTQGGDFGLYAIGNERWICKPEYDSVSYVDEGFELRRFFWNEGQDDYYNLYDYADTRGRIVRTGVSEEERSREMKMRGKTAYDYVHDKEDFAQRYPDILGRHHASIDNLDELYGYDSIMFSVTDRNGMIYYYDNDGTLLFTFEKSKLGEEDYAIPFVVNNHVSYLRVVTQDEENYQYRYYLYRDGVLFKELADGDGEQADSFLFDIEEQFYLRSAGNYTYVYNYQDELCAKFLEGWLME